MATGTRRSNEHGGRRGLATRRLGFIEPDLIGEWFVLSLLRFPNPEDEDRHLPQGRSLMDPQGFLDLCWDNGDDRLVQFVLRCYQNHPDRVQDLDYLLPSPGKHVAAVVFLIRRVFDEWRTEFDEAGKDNDGRPQVGLEQRPIAEWATRLFEILQEHVEDQDLSGCADDLLTTMAHYVHFSTWLQSELVRARATGLNVSASAALAGSQRRSILERSKQIIKARLGRSAYMRSHGKASEAGDAFSAVAGLRDLDEADDDSRLAAQSMMPGEANPVSAFYETALRSFETRSPAAKLRFNLVRQTLALPDNSVAMLSAKLLSDAAKFFRTIADQNDAVRDQMLENADVFGQMASLLRDNPRGFLEGNDGSSTSISDLAGRLLRDAADFFETLAESNPSLQEQMTENASVFREIGERLAADPFEVLG